MQPKLSILDLHDQLVFYSTKRPSGREAKLSAAAGVALVSGAAVTMMTFRAEATASHAELRVNRQELVLETRNGESIQAPRRPACFDIQWLEYRPATPIPAPNALKRDSTPCCRAAASASFRGWTKEAATIIERIGSKFPELREQWEKRSPLVAEYSS